MNICEVVFSSQVFSFFFLCAFSLCVFSSCIFFLCVFYCFYIYPLLLIWGGGPHWQERRGLSPLPNGGARPCRSRPVSARSPPTPAIGRGEVPPGTPQRNLLRSGPFRVWIHPKYGIALLKVSCLLLLLMYLHIAKKGI